MAIFFHWKLIFTHECLRPPGVYMRILRVDDLPVAPSVTTNNTDTMNNTIANEVLETVNRGGGVELSDADRGEFLRILEDRGKSHHNLMGGTLTHYSLFTLRIRPLREGYWYADSI